MTEHPRVSSVDAHALEFEGDGDERQVGEGAAADPEEVLQLLLGRLDLERLGRLRLHLERCSPELRNTTAQQSRANLRCRAEWL